MEMWETMIAIIEFIFDLVLCEIDTILIIELLNRSYGKPKKNYKLLYFCATIITLMITVYFHYAGNYSSVFSNIIVYFVIIGFYHSKLIKKVLFSITLLSLNISALLILNDITNMINSWILLILVCYHIVFWGILYFSMRCNSDLYADIPLFLWVILYMIPCFCLIGTFFSLILLSDYGNQIVIAAQYHLPIQITFFIINLTVFVLYAEFVKFHIKSQENVLLNQQVEYQTKQYKIAEDSWNKIREMRHEMKNQLQTALYLYKDGEHGELINYLENSLNQFSEIEAKSHTGNLVIDAFLNVKLTEIHDANIRCNTDIVVPSNFNFSFNDVVILLGNLFDNAKEACSQLPDDKRNIDFSMMFTQNALLINMKNPYQGTFSKETRKSNSSLHGLGLKNIEKVANKYNGIINYTSENNIFSIDIILYFNN